MADSALLMPAVALTEPAATPVEADVFAPVYPFPRPALVSGRGSRVFDAGGRDYLDFVSGIGVNALGHAPAGLAAAVARQMKELIHCSNLYGNRPAFEFAKALTQATGYDRVFLCNSGSEGIEASLKFARLRAAALGRPARDVVAFSGGFHGRTMFALSATWSAAYREPFAPLVPGVRFAPFNDVAGLATAIDDSVAAVIVEPVQGESGAVPATPEFLLALRERCTAVGATLIFDEVQCGMGRTGHLLAATGYGVRADITVLSKALGGGLPCGAVLMTADIAAALKPGHHGTTFGGGPVAATAGLFVLGRINTPAFLARVRKSGDRLAAGLRNLVDHHATLGEARGRGLLRAVELSPGAPFDPPGLIRAAFDEGLLVARGGDRAIRFLPPLNVAPKEIDQALARFEAALRKLTTSTTKGDAS
jgi:acetylornithine/N-succinyldiaminopimelate aminotransferase